MTAPTEPWYFRTLADDLIDTVRKGYELDPANIVGSLRSAADQIDHLTAECDQARQMLADAWDEGVSFGWHSTELRIDENPYRKAGL